MIPLEPWFWETASDAIPKLNGLLQKKTKARFSLCVILMQHAFYRNIQFQLQLKYIKWALVFLIASLQLN